jgi:hypothetical protein
MKCPFDIPVVTLPPHSTGGFSWGYPIQPMGDPCVTHIAIDPTNDLEWYVGGVNGLYLTKDGGKTWTHPFNSAVGALVLVPGNPLVYVGVMQELYLSRDKGKHWNVVGTYQYYVSSVLATSMKLYVGLHWNTHAVPSGVFVSNLGGGLSKFHSFGAGQTGLRVWTLARDPISGTLYAGTEIFDHPQPYHPPFFRSSNGGVNWTNVAGTLPLHVIAAAVRPTDGFVYALTEGPGLFGSANQGASWNPLAKVIGPSVSLLMDPAMPMRLFGGRLQKVGVAGTMTGGIFVSVNAGKTFHAIGLKGVTVAGVALNGPRTRLFAAAYASGVYVSPVP